jgi:hypothetical protein
MGNLRKCDYCGSRLTPKTFRVVVQIQERDRFRFKRYHKKCFPKVITKEILK